MRPLLVAWLAARAVPDWLAPDYATLTGAAALLAAWLALRQARRDGAALHHEARALLAAYLGALGGGYAFELLRAVPEALATASPHRLLAVGRAAYGGLLFASLAAAAYLRWQRQPVAPFFDRVAAGTGLTYVLVRVGCFLEGCDYGAPTASALAVRFPPGSRAAADHAARGWIHAGGPSLPVHPTQLYEALCGALAGGAAWLVLRRQRARDGSAFATFLALYAVGRFAVEALRGDAERGRYGALSTAQWVSLAVLAGVAARAWRGRATCAPRATP